MKRGIRGITMIALVITIVVLLILAGISIAAITGDNGIITKSDEAKIETEISQYKEQLEVIKHEEYADDGYTINVDVFLDKYAEAVRKDKMFKDAKEVTADHDNKLVIVVTKEGYRFEITIEDTTYVGNDNNDNTEIDMSKVKITITSSPTNWTNGKVKIKISSNITRVGKEYSLDRGNTWKKYENEIDIQDNGIEVQARGVNEKNEKTEIVKKRIENIDRLEPNTFTPTIRATTNRIEISASTTDKEATTKDGTSGIKGYKFSKDNGGNWTSLKTDGVYTYDNLNPGTTYPIKVKAIDNAGNEVETNTTNGITEEEITIPDGEGRIKFTKEPTGWTRGAVKVGISTEEQGYGIEYSIDGSKYTSYTGEIEISENKTIYARLTKGGKVGKNTTYQVDNIDRLAPKEFNVKVTGKTTNTITVQGNTTDEEGTQTDGSSGIRGYKFSKDNGRNWTEEQESGTYTFTGLSSGGSYQIKIKAIDKAGNEREAAVINEGTTQIPSGEGNIIINATPTDWTKERVRVEIITEVKEYTLQYSKDNSSWQEYTGVINVENNGETIYARLWNGSEGGASTSKTIENIDKISPNEFIPEIRSTTSTITIVANATDGEATMTSGKSGIRGYKFSRDGGYSWTEERGSGTYSFSGLTSGSSYQIKAKAIDKAGNERETKVINASTTEIPGGEGNIIINTTPTTWTNGRVRVEIQSRVSGYTLQYSTNGSSWQNYNGEFEISDNGTTIYARLYDGSSAGEVATKTISNIDRLSPNSFTPGIEVTTNTITITANTSDRNATQTDGSSGIRGYKFSKDNGYSYSTEQEYGTYTFSGLTSGSGYSIKVKAIDRAGNEYETTENYVYTKELPNPSEKIQITKTPTNWTNGAVTVKMTNTATEYILQYSTDNNSWKTYLSPITVENNYETIYARLYEPNSQEATRSISTQITNIDRLSPKIFTPTVKAGIDTITVTADTTDREATYTDGKSGIRGYKFSKDSGYSWTQEQTSGTYTFGRLSPGTTYRIRVIAIDNAGNEMEGYEVTGTTIEIPGGNNNIFFNYSPSGWTNGNVTVTISATTSNYRLQYSKDGYTWYDYDNYSKVTMTSNGTIYARLTDGTNYGTTATGNVSNIDKVAPTISYTTSPSTGTASQVTIYINATDSLSGIRSITNTTYGNITKIDERTYTVTANGTYNFEAIDNAGNRSTTSVYISNIEMKKLRIGDYVDYIPNNNSSYTIDSQYSGESKSVTATVENLNWRVFDIKDNGMVELISDVTKFKTFFKGPEGYNNMVYLYNDLARKLYSNPSINATARSIKEEDITSKIIQGYDYIDYSSTSENYGKIITSTNRYYPTIWKQTKGSDNKVDGISNNGTLGESEQISLITSNHYGQANYSMEAQVTVYHFTKETKNNMKVVETKESDYDNQIYNKMLADGLFELATRSIANDNRYSNYIIFAKKYFIPGFGMAWYEIMSNDRIEYLGQQNAGFKIIVTLPKSAINLNVGNGDLGNGWGIN